MGTHNSKENHQIKSSRTDTDLQQTFIPLTIKVNQQTNYNGWQEIYRCSHAEWIHGVSGE